MNLLKCIPALLQDPPPALAFELSESGIAVARLSSNPVLDFRPLPPGVISVSPLHDNILMPGELASAVQQIAPSNGHRKRRDAALILPDYCTRMSVLDFDGFPSDAKEQEALVRFRFKKSVPFDVESAALSYWPQSVANQKQTYVVAVVAPIEIIARYEAPFRAAGMNPGMVLTSSMAALRLIAETVPTVVAKLNGGTLTVMVLDKGVLKLIRCLELTEPALSEIAADLYPTFVYVEDNLGTKVEKLLLCGFGALLEPARQQFHSELGIEVEPVRSPFGVPGEHNAGLLGYTASVAAPA